MEAKVGADFSDIHLGKDGDPVTVLVVFTMFLVMAVIFASGDGDAQGAVFAWSFGLAAAGIIAIYTVVEMRRARFRMDDSGAVLKRGGQVMAIRFGPDVEADVKWASMVRADDGWEGMVGFSFIDGERTIRVGEPEFDKDFIREAWPSFVWVVRHHKMTMGPKLRAMFSRIE